MTQNYVYQNFLISGKKLTPNPYLDPLTKNHIKLLTRMKRECLAREQAKYREVFGVIGHLPWDWKIELKDSLLRSGDLRVSGMSEAKMKELAGKSYKQRWKVSRGRGTGQANFIDLFEMAVVDEFNKTYPDLALGGPSIDEGLEALMVKIYRTLHTRATKGSITFTKKTNGIQGKGVAPLTGLLIEAVDGILNHNKVGTINNNKMSLIADFEVPGWGLNEVKRGIVTPSDNDSKYVLENSVFHIGDFSISSILGKSKNDWTDMLNDFAVIVAEILDAVTSNPKMRVNEMRRMLASKLSYLVTDYIEMRLLAYLNMGSDIFWFSSNQGILLGSEFIEGILNYQKLNIYGHVNLIDYSSQKGTLKKMLTTYEELCKMFNRQELSTTVLLSQAIQAKTKTGSFLKSGTFNLWYGTR